MIIDIYLLYSFVRRLVTPFNKWKAYDDGTIDENGNILVPRKQLSGRSKDNFGLFDLLILNLKKLLAKLPGGSTKIATFGAALFLLKEEKNITEENIEEIINNIPSLLESHIREAKLLVEEGDAPAGIVGGGTTPITSNSVGNIARKNDKSTLLFKKTVKRKKKKDKLD
jgi:hypothetical protein